VAIHALNVCSTGFITSSLLHSIASFQNRCYLHETKLVSIVLALIRKA
jgi:hypothetical protein